MINFQLVTDPDGREDDFVVIDYDGDLRSYKETKFNVNIEGDRVSVIPLPSPFYSPEE